MMIYTCKKCNKEIALNEIDLRVNPSVSAAVWACIGIEADDIYETLRQDAGGRKRATLKRGNVKPEPVRQLIAEREDPEENRPRTILAKAFNTKWK